MFTALKRLFAALVPFTDDLAMAIALVILALVVGHAPAAQASSGGSGPVATATPVPVIPGPVICKVCPPPPQPPALGPLTLTAKNDALLIKGQGFSPSGGVDLYFWQNATSGSLVNGGTFAGMVHTTAHGSALNVSLPVTFGPYTPPGGLCFNTDATYVVAIDEKTQLGSGIQEFGNCVLPALGLGPVTAHPSLKAVLNATTGTIHVSGRHYTPHTSVAVYLYQNGLPLPVPFPVALTAKGTRFATTLSTNQMACSSTLWTTFALDQTANAASPLRTVQNPCPFKG